MQIILRGPAAGYEAEHTARLFFHDAEKTENLPQDSDFVLAQSHLCTDTILLRLHGRLYWKIALRPQGADPEYTLCRLLYTLLGEATGSTPPWGMMTGVRPVRIIHDMRASGATEDEIRARFLDHFACTPEKFALALGIADLQKPVLDAADPMDCSVYAGIPFCPTRCAYCSFVAQSVEKSFSLVEPYLEALFDEITAAGQLVRDLGLNVKSFYMGGGTPTTLTADQMDRLLTKLEQNFDFNGLAELTIEAGRPDTIDPEKLRVLRAHNTTRVSINPQTMEDNVLAAIGRRHTADDIRRAMEQVRAANFPHVNMDLIAGLPEDTPEGFARSLDEVISMGADNITVHTLSLKKGSRIMLEGCRIPGADEVAQMLDYADPTLRKHGFAPYYLYRQKYMSGSFENVGWTKPGGTGLYNIYIMEELHSILSLGGGGMNKINLPEEKLARYHNPKIPQDYISRIDTILQQKDEIFSILRGLREQNP